VSLVAEYDRVKLPLEHPFTIARGTQETAENVVVRISDGGGMTGVGAAAPSRRYGETAGTVGAVLPALLDEVRAVGDPHALGEIERRLRSVVERNPAARCAVSVALHDLAAKRLGVPLYRMWGHDPERVPDTSFTIGIDDPETVREKTEDAVEAGHSVLKIKVGTDDDEALLDAVRDAAPGATLRVDANEAWTPREAVRRIERLADYDVEFVEQPVPADDPEGLEFVHERSELPIAADESCVTPADVPRVAGHADVANVKLMKCGGLREATRMLHTARAHGLETMLGCMIETNVAIAAACHLAPLLDYADLDGSLLLAEDPFEGVDLTGGEIRLADLDRAGTGAREVRDAGGVYR